MANVFHDMICDQIHEQLQYYIQQEIQENKDWQEVIRAVVKAELRELSQSILIAYNLGDKIGLYETEPLQDLIFKAINY